MEILLDVTRRKTIIAKGYIITVGDTEAVNSSPFLEKFRI
jgi:hypothetical protein